MPGQGTCGSDSSDSSVAAGALRGKPATLQPFDPRLPRAAATCHPFFLPALRFLEAQPAEQRGALWGVPFAVKDNIDVAGHPTTAACRAFEYMPSQHARAVQPLLDAGGLL